MTSTSIQQRLEDLTEEQRRQLAERLRSITHRGEDYDLDGGHQQLVAFVVAKPSAADQDLVAGLSEYLTEHLPSYMIPSRFHLVESVPRTSSGKIDRRRLSTHPQHRQADLVDRHPRAGLEDEIANIWKDVLELNSVGRHEHFLELGGDSILSIYVASRIREAGYDIPPGAVLTHPTIAKLAAEIAKSARSPGRPVEQPATGVSPLLPIQRWFFELQVDNPDWWNQAVFLEAPGDLTEESFYTIARKILSDHDVLRSRFTQAEEGWIQIIDPEPSAGAVTCIDLSNVPPSEVSQRIDNISTELQSSVLLNDGPLVRFTLLRLGDNQQRMLICAHHLVVDNISWTILLEDLEAYGRQLHDRADRRQRPKSTAFRSFARRTQELANNESVLRDLDFWKRQLTPPFVHPPGLTAGTEADADVLKTSLSKQDTRLLTERLPHTLFIRPHEALIGALALTLGRHWNKDTVRIGIESHGRTGDFAGELDLSRTVGWFTAYYPLAVSVGGDRNLPEAFGRIKDQIRSVPNEGVTFGIARYLLDAPEADELRAAAYPDVLFNYMGKAVERDKTSMFKVLDMVPGCLRSRDARLTASLEVNAQIKGGRMHITWTYDSRVLQRDVVEGYDEKVISVIRDLAARATQPDSKRAVTPSDFPEAGLSQDDLDKLLDGLD